MIRGANRTTGPSSKIATNNSNGENIDMASKWAEKTAGGQRKVKPPKVLNPSAIAGDVFPNPITIFRKISVIDPP